MPNIEIVRKENYAVTNWSGGTTTELYIYPKGASYQARNFSWRLSMATVADEKSVFTALPGVKRTLMLLSGQILLQHEGHHQKALSPFEQDSFQGDWQTTSFGQGTDFNLMLKNDYKGRVSHVSLKDGEPYAGSITAVQIIYVWQGVIVLTLDNKEIVLDKEDLCLIEGPCKFTLANDKVAASDVILTEICK